MQLRVIEMAAERLIHGRDGFIEAIQRTVVERKIFIDQDTIGLHPQSILMLGQRVLILPEVHKNVAEIRPRRRISGILALPLLVDRNRLFQFAGGDVPDSDDPVPAARYDHDPPVDHAGGQRADPAHRRLAERRAERGRLEKEMAKVAGDIARIDAKLGNSDFVKRAPEEVVEGEREKREEAESRRAKILEALERLEGAA